MHVCEKYFIKGSVGALIDHNKVRIKVGIHKKSQKMLIKKQMLQDSNEKLNLRMSECKTTMFY